MKLRRFDTNPIIRPHMDGRMGDNINGPSLIRAPEWLKKPLGKYYLYFAHHQGKYIRLAYSDRLEGPWKTWEPGTLSLEHSFCEGHVASPDVHVDDERKRILMYYHGPTTGGQMSRLAISEDGIEFKARPEILGRFYLRMFQWGGWWYGIAKPGIVYRSKGGLTRFDEGREIFPENFRHCAVMLEGDALLVFYSNIGDCPEHILLSKIALHPDWTQWKPTQPVSVLKPETEYEGADLPLETSEVGWAPKRVRQLRDPAIFQEDGKTYLLYSVAGEHGIAIAELTLGD